MSDKNCCAVSFLIPQNYTVCQCPFYFKPVLWPFEGLFLKNHFKLSVSLPTLLLPSLLGKLTVRIYTLAALTANEIRGTYIVIC